MKFKTIIIYLILCFSPSLHAQEDEIVTIDSSRANYDGEQIVLSGDVVVEQKIGKMYAGHMVLTPEGDQKKLRFACLKMQDDVKLELKEGGRFLCAHAEIDYLKSQGKFNGNQAGEYVIYTEACALKGSKRLPLTFKSCEMHVDFKNDDKNHKIVITKMRASRNVTLNYNHDFIASADSAVYQRLEGISTEEKFPGHIDLSAGNRNGMCQITNKNGDLIRATKIYIDTLNQKMQFASPKGYLSLSSKENKAEKVFFDSETLDWDPNLKAMTFKGDIKVTQKNYGELLGDEEVKLYYTEEKGKRDVSLVESLGETVIAYMDDDKKLIHTLTSYGKATVDHLLQKLIIESPLDADGHVSEGRQLYFNDILGEIYADSAVFDYKEVEGVIMADKLILKGNVKILNRSTVNPEESEAFLQYALADQVEYNPETSEMLMTASDGSRVLFYDRASSLQISAPGVKIKRNAMTKKESIQGLGDARFSLIDHELEKLKKHFSLEPMKREAVKRETPKEQLTREPAKRGIL